MTVAARPAQQIESLTALRGVLAVWVVLYHYWNELLVLFPAAGWLTPVCRHGHFAVPGFFALSGFVLAHTYGTRFAALGGRALLRFWAMRLARLYPVHLTCLLAVAVMVAASDRLGYRLDPGGYTTADFLRNLLMIHTWVPHFRLNWNYPSWSISSEWFAYLLFPFAARWVLPRLGGTARAAAAVSAGASVTLLVYSFGAEWPFRELLVVVPTFFSGLTLFALVRSRPPATGRPIRFLPEVCLLAGGAACFLPGEFVAAGVLLAEFVLIGVLAHAGGRCGWVWRSRPLVAVGEVSYSLYMTHTLGQKLLYRLLPTTRFVEDAIPIKIGVACAYAATVLAFCLVWYFLVEKPCRGWVRARLRRSTAGA